MQSYVYGIYKLMEMMCIDDSRREILLDNMYSRVRANYIQLETRRNYRNFSLVRRFF